MTNTSGAVISETRYTAWGEVRYQAGTMSTGYTYTGQYSNTADFGLMYYNARWYDPALGRFAQADSIIPQNQGVQAWDRYAYVNNNPIRYTDPSGHGVDCGIGTGCVNDYSDASTLDDFENMSWVERKRWLSEFASERNLENWFDDMGSAIDFMSSDGYMSKEGSITEVMDAAVLQAIKDGWDMYSGGNPVGGGQGWADFFNLLRPIDGSPSSASQSELNIARLQAEQTGVNYSYNLPSVKSALSNASLYEKIYFDAFKFDADGYRTIGIYTGIIDPRTAGPYLSYLSEGIQYQAAVGYALALGFPAGVR